MADLGTTDFDPVTIDFEALLVLGGTYRGTFNPLVGFIQHGFANGIPETVIDPLVDIVTTPVPSGAPDGTRTERWYQLGSIVTRIPIEAGGATIAVSVRKNPEYEVSWSRANGSVVSLLPTIELFDVRDPGALLASDVMDDLDDTWDTLSVSVVVTEATVLLLRRTAWGLGENNLAFAPLATRSSDAFTPQPALCYWSWMRFL